MRKKGLITVVFLALALILVGCSKSAKDDQPNAEGSKNQSKAHQEELKSQIPSLPGRTGQPGEALFLGGMRDSIKLPRPVMVMVENSPSARPQAGLEDASIVYEFMAEGGISRFMALFYEKFPEKVGPVRSTRPYFVQTAKEYNALLLHCGGSTDAFKELKATGLDHMDEMSFGRYFWRDKSRKAPHNAYTGYTKMQKVFEKQFDYRFSTPFNYETATEAPSPDVTVQEIKIPYVKDYLVSYRYEKSSGQYVRFINGKWHLMEGGKRLTADNIFVRYVDTKVVDKALRLEMNLEGSGKALFFKDGQAYTGTWSKVPGGQTRFLDQNGNEWKLKPGKTWIQVVPTDTQVTYQ